MVWSLISALGLMQTHAAVEVGYWDARSSEFMQTPIIDKLRWVRAFGDTVFAFGAVTLVLFVAGLATGHAYRRGGAANDATAPLGSANERGRETDAA